MTNKEEFVEYFDEYLKLNSIEAQVVKFADALDAFVQGFNTPSANLEDLRKTVGNRLKKKIKDALLAELFDKSVYLIGERKVTVYKGHIGSNQEKQSIL